MKLLYLKIDRLIMTFILNISIIFIFAIIYLNISNDFFLTYGKNRNIDFIDCLLTSTSIQAGVGISNLMPLTTLSKVTMTIHQIIMITTNLLSIIFVLVV
jgi:hypothetical protein